MLTRAVGYAYPWDYAGDSAAAPRAVASGVDMVAVAASYHATRASTPLHPEHRTFDAERAACYVPVRSGAWHGHRLVPESSAWDPHGRSFGDAHRQLSAQGLEVAAWIVLTHNSALGRAHPDLTVRNAFGDVYPYALCPAQQDVREYCLTLVAEVLAAAPVGGVVLEACGPMGVDHGGNHDKLEFARWDPTARALLSLCFCSACRELYAAAGVDSDVLARSVRTGVDGGSGTIEERLGEMSASVAAVRMDIAAVLRALLVASCRSIAPGCRVTVHGSSDPWATGSFSTLQPAPGDGVDTVVANCWDPPAGAGRIGELSAMAHAGAGVGAYLRLDRDWEAGAETDRLLSDYLGAGMTELHLYHLGLLAAPGLERMREVAVAARRLAGRGGRG